MSRAAETWSDAEIDTTVELMTLDTHPLRIAKALGKPAKEVVEAWHNIINTWAELGDSPPPSVAEWRARHGR